MRVRRFMVFEEKRFMNAIEKAVEAEWDNKKKNVFRLT